jgi:hypothetical protein
VTSVRTVNTNRSAKQFARGHRGGILMYFNTCVGQHLVERCRELSGPIADEESEPGDVFPRSMRRLRGLPGGPGSVRMRGDAQDVQVAVADLQSEQDVDALQRDRAVDVEEVDREHAGGLVRRNCRQLVSVWRIGAGGVRWRWGMRRIVEAPIRWPSVSSSPWILRYPQVGLSVCIRTTSAAIASLIGGRPDRLG